LQQALQQKKLSGRNGSTPSGPAHINLFQWWYVAAVFVGLCISSFIGWKTFIGTDRIEYVTAFGETRALVLPDGSQVMLNGNTRLSYNEEWAAQGTREVWLSGEAYFSVQKSPDKAHARFIVHTEKLDVEVLGTQFNVSGRKNATQVVLNEGEVKVNPGKSANVPSLIMKPGELVEYSGTRQPIIRKVVNPQIYSSWKFKRMVFEETTMKEIAARIEATYGYRVLFADTDLASRRLTGTIPSDNIDVLLLTLSKLFNLDIRKDQNQLFIKSNK
jgi:ferric-dicitrate binding protein FerR (iron transport regulator)